MEKGPAFLLALAAAVAAVVPPLAACATKPSPYLAEVPRMATSMVNASALIGACPDAHKMNAKTATETINKLVEPCAQVPGGKAHFSARLMPGGRIELASPEGSVAEGVVPTCVLSNSLVHKLQLTKPCVFDVQLEERKIGGTPAP